MDSTFFSVTEVHDQATKPFKQQILTASVKALVHHLGKTGEVDFYVRLSPFTVRSLGANVRDTMYRLTEKDIKLQHLPILKGEERYEKTS